MIKSIWLRNFRRHVDLNLEFANGLNSITGENDTGKSTILRAIIYCLFGPVAAGIPKDRLWRRGTDENSQRLVKLELSEGYTLQRCEKGASVYRHGEGAVASGHTPVTKWVEKHFGMSSQDLLAVMYSPQGEAQQFLDMGPTGLQKKIEKLAGLEELDAVVSLVSTELNAHKKLFELYDLKGKSSKELEAELQKSLDELAAVKASLDSVELEHKREEAKLKTAYEGNQSRARLEEKLASAERDVERCKARLDKAKADPNLNKANIVTAHEAGKEYHRLLDEAKALRSNLEEFVRLSKELSVLGSRMKDAKPLLEEQDRLAEELYRIRENLALMDQEIATQAVEVKALKQARDKARGAFESNVCQTCLRPFGEFDLEKAKKDWEGCRSMFDEGSAVLDALQAGRANLKMVEAAAEKKVNACVRKQFDLDARKVEELKGLLAHPETPWVSEYDARLKDEETERAKQAYVESAKADQAYTLATQEHGVAEQEYAEALRLRYNADSMLENAPLWVDTEGLAEAVKGLRARWFEEGARCAALGLQAAATKNELASVKEAEDKYLKTKEEVDVLTALLSYLRTSRERLSSEIWASLLNYASHLVSVATRGKMGVLTREGGEFFAGGVPVSDFGGSRKSVVGLALRIAMSKVFFGQGGILLLDEVSADASDGSAAEIAGMLLGLGMQCIEVSHRSSAQSLAGNIIEIGE